VTLNIRIPWRRLVWALVILLPVAAVGVILWLSTRDLSRYQTKLTEQIRKSTGRELKARVPLSVKLGREPTLVAEGVTLSNAAWAKRPELAKVRRLTLYLDPFSVFLGEAKVAKVMLESRIHRVLITKGDKLAGIVTTMDLLRALIALAKKSGASRPRAHK